MLRSAIFKRSSVLPSRMILRSSRSGIAKSSYALASLQNVRFNSTGTSSENIATAASEITSQLPSFADKVNEAAVLTSDTIGYLNSVGLPGNSFKGIFEHSLEYIHVYTGLPWWMTIVLGTLAFRAVLFPITLKSNENMTRTAAATPELNAIKEQMRQPDLTMPDKVKLQKQMSQVSKKYGIKWHYALAPFLQMGGSIGLFISIREMCLHPVQGFTDQGAYWFHDLVASDPYAALPISSALVYTGLVRYGGEHAQASISPAIKKMMTIMPIVSIPFTMQLSAGVSLYLFTSALFSLLQGFLLTNTTTRNLLGLSPKVIKPKTEQKDEGIKEALSKWSDNFKEKAESKAREVQKIHAERDAIQARNKQAKAYIRKRGKKANK